MRRITPAFLTVAMLGVVGLLVVAYVGKKLLAREAPAPVDTRMSVPMALTELEPGTRITEAHLAMGPVDRTKVTRDTVLTSRVLLGRVVKNKIEAAQPLSTLDFYPPGKNAPLNIDPGMVAVAVEAPAPFVAERGQFVNVHFTPESDPDSEETGGRIMTLFQGVKVLDVSGGTQNRSALNVTLELTKEQSNIILLAREKGKLDFTFAPDGKGSGVVAINDADRATLYEILGYRPAPPPAKPEPPVTTDIFRGPDHGVNAFKNGRYWDDYNDGGANGGGIQSGQGRNPLRGGGGRSTGGGGGGPSASNATERSSI